ncbi:hypothetical protein MTO98_10715 [Mucilaginibacter sp. SMC90]|uniref:hypothetical protein n=1 Tax=Mucilaginibacter sp. SMC90 TaxID=2929803 RepID=UPI001FB1CE9B|nr:hypothetical protein [Mucilaginibacter sp. SMC90]UOE51550.1 hypothetical protein MTO98_10715 [Mucilaginibacter sp. SMC90]
MKAFLFCFLIMILTGVDAGAQAKNVSGVYAGIELTLPVTMGAGMGRNDVVYMLRPDGTFNDLLKKPDWKTRVAGHYQVQGNTLKMQYLKGSKQEYKFEADGDIDAGSFNILKLNTADRVPAGYYEFTHASSAGGMNTGQVFVGTAGEKGLYFDGKGNFSQNSSSATMVSGEGIGGGGSHKDSGEGTYTIKDGTLTLTYSTGKSETHSFFCRPGEKPIMAAIDGNIYFMKDKAPKSASSVAKTAPGARGNTAVATTESSATGASNNNDGASLLRKAAEVHGGAKLDAIKTMQVSATMMGIDITLKIDLTARRVRSELRKGGKLLQVEQMEGDNGWQWRNGSKQPLSAARLAQLKQGFRSGPLLFRKENLDKLQNVKAQQGKNNMVIVSYNFDGVTSFAALNGNSQLVGEGTKTGSVIQASAFTGFKTVDGIVLPAAELQSEGTQKSSITYNDYKINPSFTDADWADAR